MEEAPAFTRREGHVLPSLRARAHRTRSCLHCRGHNGGRSTALPFRLVSARAATAFQLA